MRKAHGRWVPGRVLRSAMAADLVEVAVVHGPVEAAVVRGLLECYDIPVTLEAGIPHAIWPFTIDGPGEVRVLVNAEDAFAATDLIARHRQAGLVVLPGQAKPTDAA